MIPSWLEIPCANIDKSATQAAQAHQQQLTKPPSSLGILEQLAVRFAGMQGVKRPTLERPHITVFAGDHGVAEEGVSAFPQAVTAEMVRNFAHGGAAISVLARESHAHLEVINTGTVSKIEPLKGVLDARIAAGTANFSKKPAMSVEQLYQALNIGRSAVIHASELDMQLFIAGEMGIANTSAATALSCSLLNLSAKELTGPGTGLDSEGMKHKAKVIDNALMLHQKNIHSALDALQHFAGFEMVAIVGAYISAAQHGIPILVDGFITTATALAAVHIKPEIEPWLIYSHASQEPGHAFIMDALKAQPLIDLKMCLGEGSGAATVLPLLRLACNLHSQMATFKEAAVSGKL